MKVPRLSLAKLHGFSHGGDDCPLKILWRSLYKAKTYEEFVMLAMLNQEPNAPIDLGTVQSFIYEYSCGWVRNANNRKKLREFRDVLCVERFRRGDIAAFEVIQHLLEPPEIFEGRKKYDKWWENVKSGNLQKKRGIELYHND